KSPISLSTMNQVHPHRPCTGLNSASVQVTGSSEMTWGQVTFPLSPFTHSAANFCAACASVARVTESVQNLLVKRMVSALLNSTSVAPMMNDQSCACRL